MKKKTQNPELKALMLIPGVGKSIAMDLYKLGIRQLDDLKGKNPNQLYEQSNRLAKTVQDPCLLYTFRCAVYFAETEVHLQEPVKLKWWYWKDGK